MRALVIAKTWDGKTERKEFDGHNVNDCLAKIVPALDDLSDHVSLEWTKIEISIERPIPFSRGK